MKKYVKRIIKKAIGKKRVAHISYAEMIYERYFPKKNKVLQFLKVYNKIKIFYSKQKGNEIKKLFKSININCDSNDYFFYNIDIYKSITNIHFVIDNLSIDYSKILNNSLEDFKKDINSNNNIFYIDEMCLIEGIELLIDRIVGILKKSNNKNRNNIIESLRGIKDKKANGLFDSLQRILFWNMLLWQTGHKLNGLGRMDLILNNYYNDDIQKKLITEDEASNLITKFFLTLHDFYEFKSSALLGDTGQIIELGGLNEKGEYLENQLTYLFIDIARKEQLPDPKIILRVSEKMSRKLMEKAIKCVQTGIGCPLFANDDIIIKKLIDYGYDLKDAYNYGTSACWEPYIIGKSSAQNNVQDIVFLKPFEDMLENEKLDDILDKEQLIEKYKGYLKNYLESLIYDINSTIKYEKDPIMSLLIDDCLRNGTDISNGGAKYNNTGLLSLGLSSVVDSIYNIEDIVFKNRNMTLRELNAIKNSNFDNNEKLLELLKKNKRCYGIDDEDIINTVNDIIIYTSNVLKDKKNVFGGRFKFGLSSPNYITKSKKALASLDGRKRAEPFSTHISNRTGNAYTELVQFASQINYSDNRFNGNVIDFFITPNFIKDNFEKFTDFLMLSIKNGFFEMQMNVVSSKQLVEAKKNPEKFPNLIVRVWGFSAYFNDLPEEYKDYLIERAKLNECNSN